VSNPFQNKDSLFLVLINSQNQHSLWPLSRDVPAGWTVAHGPSARDLCLDYIEASWKDMRPASLATAMGGVGTESTSAETERE
jgi:MbtH protein